MPSERNVTVVAVVLSWMMLLAGCQKNAPPLPPPPAAPAVQAPSAITSPKPLPPAVQELTVEPTAILRGQSANLRWDVQGEVTNISIDQQIGTVPSVGLRRVSPSESVTYTLKATGPGGTATAAVTVRVSSPPPAPPAPTSPGGSLTLDQRLSADLQDAYFDYNRSEIREDARETLVRDAAVLKTILTDFPSASIVIEGHCDERGSAEYNLGLGDRRSGSAKDFLVQFGVPAEKLAARSYGKEQPQCTEANESCWQRNRRVHFSAGQ